MRLPVLPGALALCAFAHAQDWALLNPAYRYNYSNDGTDTISNQIRVMHVDTLGVDSFRYELNTIAKVCDTCSAPGLYVLLNQPQFMQRMINAGPAVWHFHEPGSLVLLPQASLGMSWMYDTLASITATVIGQDQIQVFGTDDQIKTISLSNGDSIVISESFGILSWSGRGLIGVHGPSVGVLAPSLHDLFPYQAGDVVEYRVGEGGYDGFSGYSGSERLYRFTVASGNMTEGGIDFAGQYTEHRWDWSDPDSGPIYTFGHLTTIGSTWTAGAPEFPWSELQTAYPGQLVRGRVHENIWLPPDTAVCIARHWINDDGIQMIGCQPVCLPECGGGQEVLMFVPPSPTQQGNGSMEVQPVSYFYPDAPGGCGIQYASGIGFEFYRGCYFEWGEQYELVGAIINGDTIGTIHSEEYIILVSVGEYAASSSVAISPNPASDFVYLTSVVPGARSSITDLQGRVLREQRFSLTNERIEVQSIPPGVYLLWMDGFRPQRFAITR